MTLREFYERVYKPEYSTVYKRLNSIINDDSIFEHRLKDFHNRKLLGMKAMKASAESDWVLLSKKSASGHLEDPKRSWQDLLKRAGITNLRLHDLRRTQCSYQAITGASMNIIGKSLGHKSTSATMVYARLSADPIRESMQKATDRMLEFVGGD